MSKITVLDDFRFEERSDGKESWGIHDIETALDDLDYEIIDIYDLLDGKEWVNDDDTVVILLNIDEDDPIAAALVVSELQPDDFEYLYTTDLNMHGKNKAILKFWWG